jgi:hypothetical protein
MGASACLVQRNFERRKMAWAPAAGAFGTSCVHEHSCLRYSLLRPDPVQRPRQLEIRDNLTSRIAEAEREGWLGEVEGLKISLAGGRAETRPVSDLAARHGRVYLGMPDFFSRRGPGHHPGIALHDPSGPVVKGRPWP